MKTRTFSSLYKKQPGWPGQDVKTGRLVTLTYINSIPSGVFKVRKVLTAKLYHSCRGNRSNHALSLFSLSSDPVNWQEDMCHRWLEAGRQIINRTPTFGGVGVLDIYLFPQRETPRDDMQIIACK